MNNKKKVLIVEDNEELCNAIAAYFQKRDDIALLKAVYDGRQALSYLKDADILITDLVMPNLDGYALMERVAQMEGKKPAVIVISALGTEEMVHRACDLGARYYMVKPLNIESLYRRTLEVAGQAASTRVGNGVPVPSLKPLDEKITNVFLMVGIPAHIKGYQYLRYGVRLVVEGGGVMNRITKELYPAIAEHFDTSPSKVERAIRHAIDVAWSRGKIENINRIFGFHIYTKNDKPTNGEFIALVADKLSMELSA
ncbi:MAG: sporulation transcription factor Spo0A [Clostridiales bacterium]|nr:sporulation transcription factor Spo0A [Clostridiales bacterium]